MSISARIPGTSAWRHRRALEICRQTAACIDRIVDGEMPPSRKLLYLESHLAVCRRCRGEAEVTRQLKGAIARVAQEVDPKLVGRLEELARRLCSEPEATT